MTAHFFRLIGAGVASASLLAACGGGGTSAATTSATASFALSAGYSARINKGATDNFILSGDCSGTASIATAAAVPSTFEGVTGYSAGQVSTVNFTKCTSSTPSTTGTTYFNANYVPIGLSINGGEYSSNTGQPAPSTLPTTVIVGNSGPIDTMTTYADSTKMIVTGKRVLSFAIEPDTSTTTAIANIITKSYDQANNLLATQQSRYHMAADGTLTLASIDVQFAYTSTIHLVYTPQ